MKGVDLSSELNCTLLDRSIKIGWMTLCRPHDCGISVTAGNPHALVCA